VLDEDALVARVDRRFLYWPGNVFGVFYLHNSSHLKEFLISRTVEGVFEFIRKV
jgi:hypothetical protein